MYNCSIFRLRSFWGMSSRKEMHRKRGLPEAQCHSDYSVAVKSAVERAQVVSTLLRTLSMTSTVQQSASRARAVCIVRDRRAQYVSCRDLHAKATKNWPGVTSVVFESGPLLCWSTADSKNAPSEMAMLRLRRGPKCNVDLGLQRAVIDGSLVRRGVFGRSKSEVWQVVSAAR